MAGGAGDGATRAVLRLAWPATLSFLLNNAYRMNDQYWVAGLGPEAQAAIGTTTFVLIMNFAALFLAAGGALTHIARSVGAGSRERRDTLIRHAVGFGVALSAGLSLVGAAATPGVVSLLGLEGAMAEHAGTYLTVLYVGLVPMALVPVLDGVFIGLGETRVPLLMQLTAVSLNFVLNPLLIYGAGPFEGLGIAGAAVATCASRLVAGGLGVAILTRWYGVRLFVRPRAKLEIVGAIARTGLPTSLSIAAYAGVYWLVVSIVISKLGRDVLAGGLGIGFTVFEGLSFPCFLGVGVAVSSLVGRSIGARDRGALERSIGAARRVAFAVSLFWTAFFLFGSPLVAPTFASEPGVLTEALRYVSILAWSQIFVAFEAVEERVLLGAGRTRSIFAISVPGNLLRVPLAWLFAMELDLGAAGVWWAINVSSLLKAACLHAVVRAAVPGLVEEPGRKPADGVVSPEASS